MVGLMPHVAVPDGDTGGCTKCPLPARHPSHIKAAGEFVLPPLTSPEARVGHNHPETAKRAAAAALPRSGTIKRMVFNFIASQPHGATDDEIEVDTGRSHQSVSAARNSLMNAGWIEPLVVTGPITVTRPTRSGHDAIAWIPTQAALAAQRSNDR